MYQGKFDAKARGQQTPGETLETILREREAANAAKAAKKSARPSRPAAPAADVTVPAAAKKPQASKLPAKRPDGARPAAPVKRPADAAAAPRPARPAGEQPRKPAPRPAAPAKAPAKAPVKPQTSNEVVQPVKQRGPRLGGMIFYTFYFLLIFAFFVGVFLTLNWLNGWLKSYEAAQPTVKCQEVFNQLFSDPDWAQLYKLAGVEDTDFEGVNEYVAYMENKVGNQKLDFVETSAGLSGNKKYIVRLDGEKLATFTLSGQGKSIIDIPDWKLGEVELFFVRNKSITIRKLETHSAYINGYPLDDSYTIQIASTKADESQDPANRVRTSIQCVDGLLFEPSLVVYDQTGSPIEVRYNPDSGMYEEQIDAIAITEEQRAAVFGALEAYSGFMINASGSRAGLAKYFDGSSSTYSDILKMGSELWMNSDNGHKFLNEELLGFTQHSPTLFSVRASMTMNVNCKDGTQKDYNVVQSMYFVKKDGKWVCKEMTNDDITAPVGEVRLTFCDAAGKVISSEFYSTSSAQLITPIVEVPAGKTFSGWSRIDVGNDGVKTWNIMFQPDETGIVYLGSNYSLEPMTLYPLFE